MSDPKAKPLKLSFSLSIHSEKEYASYDTQVHAGIEIKNDLIPAGTNPYDYLRARLREELARLESKIKFEVPGPEAL